jgi:hypothetical protein
MIRTTNIEVEWQVYCTDGRLAIDNNETERMLQLAAIGRKNWLFFSSANGGKNGCILSTILGSARRHGLNEYEDLVDLLERLCDLPSEGALFEMFPDRWTPRTPQKDHTIGTNNENLSRQAVPGVITSS